MPSINVNASAITALQSLRNTQAALNTTQKEISTGLKISSAADNASTWGIAELMKSDKGALATISDSLGSSGSILKVASAAVTGALDVMNKIKSAVVGAKQPGADTTKITTSLTELGSQLNSIVSSATFMDINLVDGSQTAAVTFIASYDHTNGVGTIDLTASALTNAGAGILDGGNNTDFTTGSAVDLTAANIDATLTDIESVITALTDYGATLGAVASRVKTQNEFIMSMKEAYDTGISSLVDADMNETSTRLQALQTQQQLGIQSLSIANQNAQMILKLFQ